MTYKIVFIFLSILFLLVSPQFAQKKFSMPELIKPKIIKIYNNQIYIVDGISISIYSTKDMKLKKKFGNEGEGPKEFKKKIYLIDIKQNSILINSTNKISFYTDQGEFIKELRTPPGHMRLQQLGKNYVGFSVKMDNKVMFYTCNIYNSNVKKEKEICRVSHEVQIGKGVKVFSKTLSAATYEKKLLITWKDDFQIDIFNEYGEKLNSITHEYKRIKVTKKDKESVINFLKTDPETKNFYEILKPINFQPYFPIIRKILIDDHKIYVMTWKYKNGKSEFFIFDLAGKFLNIIDIPMKQLNPVDMYPFTIKNGEIFQLFENPDTEEWELNINTIHN